MTATRWFASAFEAMTGFSPLGWQRRMFDRFLTGDLPLACDIPTGLGKTSVMAIWLLALARQASARAVTLPRRLVYVVNRRTVVDQATDEAISIRNALRTAAVRDELVKARDALSSLCVDPQDDAAPLAVSTLRGELADNREWQADPARAAIIVGTVDLIGSRLLFSGYRAGWKMRAFEAGLIGQDSLIVHDEAHLSPAFAELIRHVARVQAADREPRPLRVLELSATPRSEGSPDLFGLTADEHKEPVVKQRIRAAKALRLHPVESAEDLAERMATAALEYSGHRARILVYVRSPQQARRICDRLLRELRDESRVALLTGTLRGYERDDLVENNQVFLRLRAAPEREPIDASVFLVSTSAGEVGVNLDADHLVCDLSTLESMIQRLGRVNRFGREGQFVAAIEVFDVVEGGDGGRAGRRRAIKGSGAEAARPPFEAARTATREALRRLPSRRRGGFDASPLVLRRVLHRETVEKAFAPSPRVVPCTDILLDAWALTSLRELPGRPPVDHWLHGVESDLPETVLVWRAEVTDLVGLLSAGRRSRGLIEDWFDLHRIETRERLREPSFRAAEELEEIAKRLAKEGKDLQALVFPPDREVFAKGIGDLAAADVLAGATVVLPPAAGGLERSGMLSGQSELSVDVADAIQDPSRGRLRLLLERREAEGEEAWRIGILGLRRDGLGDQLTHARADANVSFDDLVAQVLEILSKGNDARNSLVEKGRLILAHDERGISRGLLSFGRARRPETALDVSSAAAERQTLQEHLAWTGEGAARLARRVGLPAGLSSAVEAAARLHDRGKDRVPWQRAIFNGPPSDPKLRRSWEPLAKTRHGRFDYQACPGYRHEFGSLIDALRDEAIASHPERDLVLHLVASHHARARPHFQEDACDPESADEVNAAAARETIRRYARLQRRFGRWGLAWLEGLLKAADVIATIRGEGVQKLAQ